MYSWKTLRIKKFFGIDLKTNPIFVKDGESLDNQNVYQDKKGLVQKRLGNDTVFEYDEGASVPIDEIGAATLNGTKYYFKFTGGKFKYDSSSGETVSGLTGTTTVLSPSPAISTTNQIWWAVLDDRVFFVDGTNNLRFFDGSAVYDSVLYSRPTVAPASSGGAGFDYTYTVEKGYSSTYTSGESPAYLDVSAPITIVTGASGATITITDNTGPQTLAVGDRIRIYSKASSVAAAYKNVTPTSGAHANGVYEIGDDGGGYLRITSTAASYAVVTNAIDDTQPNLYSDIGIVLNKTAPTGLKGLTVHYGRLVAWKDDTVYNSKVTNPNSWPDDAANRESFRYTVGFGDTEDMQRCVSYHESLYVFKQSQIFIFGGIGPDDTGGNAYSYRRIETNGIGCIAPKSVQIVGEEKNNYLVFLSKQGFYATSGTEPIRVGEKIEDSIQNQSASTLSSSYSIYNKKVGYYLCFVGASNSRYGWFLDTREDEKTLAGWFKWSDLPAKCVFFDQDRYLFGAYTGYVGVERVATLSTDYSDVKIQYFTTTDVNTGTEEITLTSHGYSTGDAVKVRSTGAVPTGLTANTTYYVIRVSANAIKLATSAANANLGTAINLTSTGSAVMSLVGSKAISAYYTTNWFNYGSTSVVKKVAKPSVLFNSVASTINLSVSFAYDWVSNYIDDQSIVINSRDPWGSLPWGSFVWGSTSAGAPKSLAISRRKFRSISYKFSNNTINQDFNLQGIDMPFDMIRNRDNFA